MKPRLRSPWMLPLGLLLGAVAFAAPMTDAQKIDALIHGVETLTGAQFIRNGSAYDGKAAAEHLRYKRDHAGGRCATASDFIANCASSSSMSGKPYQIRYADGKTIDAEVYFRGELKRLENQPVAPDAVNGSMRVLISTDSQRYRMSDNVKLTVLIRNDSNVPLWIYKRLEWGTRASLSLWVQDAVSNEPVPQTIIFDAMTLPPSRESFAPLPQHHSFTREQEFTMKQLNIAKPGRYRIVVNYHSPIPQEFGDGLHIWSKEMGEIASDPIEISVRN